MGNMLSGRTLRSDYHYAKKMNRQQRKAAKHSAKAQYAANMLSGRTLRSDYHYAKKINRQERRADKHAAKAMGKRSYRGQQRQQRKAAKHSAKAQYAANMLSGRTLRSD